MESKGNKQRMLSCMIRGPGPVYKLPTLVGYNGHDPSRHRGPAYSMRITTILKPHTIGPGPRYNVSKLTKSGRDNPPAYTIRNREVWKLRDLGPGPGAHFPEKCPPMNHDRRAPAYSIKAPAVMRFPDRGPGPNTYLLPTCVGPKVPDKPVQGAFSIAGYHVIREKVKSPGPAAYGGVSYDVTRRRNPAYTLKERYFLPDKYRSPAPTFYPLYDTRKRAPKYSFGIKHSECSGVPFMQLDEE